jgi:tetratricopeptide (TPR) repeat protein
MKIRLMLVALLGLITVNAFAQKGELTNANDALEKYDAVKGQVTLAKPIIMDAKTAIDKAAANQKTANLPQTFALKAGIYSSLLYVDTTATSMATNYATAQEALKKAIELDTKKENAKVIDEATRNLSQIQLNRGVTAYQNKKFDDAYKAFDAYRQLRPDDTTAIYYTALAAGNSNNYSASIANYTKLLATPYSAKSAAYNDLTNMYLANKDTAGALKTIDEALTKYPNNTDLRKRQIIISLQTGKQSDLITKIDAAIKNDPKNKELYLYEGLTYSQIAETTDKELIKAKNASSKAGKAKPGVKLPPDPQIAKLTQTRNDNFSKAADMYKKALEIDPNYFDANMNLGYVLISPAIDAYNELQKVDNQKTYDAGMVKVNGQFDAAKPYLLKAAELDPKSVDALNNLKMYYLGKKDMDNANTTQKKIDALKQ